MTAFDRLLDTFEADLDAAVASAPLAPGMNLPCLSPNPDLWWYDVTGLENGNVSAMSFGDPERVTDRYQHVVIFPTWSMGEIFFLSLAAGETVKIIATSDSDLRITWPDKPGQVVEISKEILVIAHADVTQEALEAFYAKPE